MKNEEQVVLVDENDVVLGYMGKQEAHEKGILHRAISVIIFNEKGEQLIQQRALTKYHWAGIWSNTCCSHPRENESFADAASRRLLEEIGISVPLTEAFHFVYEAYDPESKLTEHEYDAVFTGIYNGPIHFNKEEVAAIKWLSKEELNEAIQKDPDSFSFWFKIILEEFEKRSLF